MLAEVTFRPPTIETPRLLLRGWEPSDAEEVFAYASDPDVARYMSWPRHETIADAHSFLNTIVASNYQSGELDCAITEQGAPERIIGGIGAFWKPKDHQVMELGYVLARAHWGKGYVPEAARALIARVLDHPRRAHLRSHLLGESKESSRSREDGHALRRRASLLAEPTRTALGSGRVRHPPQRARSVGRLGRSRQAERYGTGDERDHGHGRVRRDRRRQRRSSGWLVKTADGQRGGKLFLYSREGAEAVADPSLAPRLELDY